MTAIRSLLFVLIASGTLVSFGGPAKRDPVAEGFPDWDGVTDKNLIANATLKSRAICPSDLRHKVVAVVVMDASDPKLQENQLPLFSSVARHNSMLSTGFEATLGAMMDVKEIPRKCVVVGSFRGKRDAAGILGALSSKNKDMQQKLSFITSRRCPLYFDLAMVGEPTNDEGKYPYCYVLNGRDNVPVWKGVLTAAAIKDVDKVIKEAAAGIPDWTPLTGVQEAVTQKTAMKHLKEGKIDAAKKALIPNLKSKDKATCTEAQMMYDAIEQYKSDMVYLVELETAISPGLAYADLSRVLKMFPTASKQLAGVQKQVSVMPGARELGDIITKFRAWKSNDYAPKNAQEAKKNVQEIVKWKKLLDGLEKSQNMKLQGDAMYLNQQLDSLKAIMESKITK